MGIDGNELAISSMLNSMAFVVVDFSLNDDWKTALLMGHGWPPCRLSRLHFAEKAFNQNDEFHVNYQTFIEQRHEMVWSADVAGR